MTVTVNNINEAPVLSGPAAVPYNEGGTGVVASYVATDPDDDTILWPLSGTDSDDFEIGNTGNLTFKTPPNYENPSDSDADNNYQVTVNASDGPLTATLSVTVTVNNINEAPVLSGPAAVPYNEGGTGVVASYVATDPDDDTILWPLSGTDSDDFEIGNTGNLTFKTPPNYENPSDSDADNNYQVTVNASDGPLTATLSVTVTVNNIDEAGTLTLSSPQPQAGTELTAELNDPDGAIANRSWSWQRSQNQISWNTISGADTSSYTPTETDVGYFLRVSVTYNDDEGNGKNAEQTSTEATRDEPVTNHAPSFTDDTTNRSVAENSPARTPIGAAVTATDDDNDPLAYSLSGTDAGSFTIDNDGQIRVGDTTTLDHETKDTYSVTVTATDPSDASDSITVEITVTDVNENPDVSIADATASEGAAVIRFAVALSAQSPLPVSVDYATMDRSATAGEDYQTAAGTLTLNAGETTTTIEVQLTDDTNIEGRETFEVALNNATNAQVNPSAGTATGTITDNDRPPPPPPPPPPPVRGGGGGGGGGEPVASAGAPAFGEGSQAARSVAENTETGTNIGEAVTATDPNDDTLTYTLGGTDSRAFDIDASTGQLQTKEPLDYETNNTYTVSVAVRDSKNPAGEDDTRRDDLIRVTINIGNVDEDGWITLSAPTPRVSTPLEAAAADPDSGISDIVWSWENITRPQRLDTHRKHQQHRLHPNRNRREPTTCASPPPTPTGTDRTRQRPLQPARRSPPGTQPASLTPPPKGHTPQPSTR